LEKDLSKRTRIDEGWSVFKRQFVPPQELIKDKVGENR
jgi:hypothetical protein